MPPFFRPVASISSLSELPSYPRLLKIGAAASTIFRLVCSPLVITLRIFNQMRPLGPFQLYRSSPLDAPRDRTVSPVQYAAQTAPFWKRRAAGLSLTSRVS